MQEFERRAATPEMLDVAKAGRAEVTGPMREEAFLAQNQFGPLASSSLDRQVDTSNVCNVGLKKRSRHSRFREN